MLDLYRLLFFQDEYAREPFSADALRSYSIRFFLGAHISYR